MTAEEDSCSDMDCKVAGNIDGITAIQMDCKYPIPYKVIQNSLLLSRQYLSRIDHIMNNLLKFQRTQMYLQIIQNMVGLFIGPKGKNLQLLIQKTNLYIKIIKNHLLIKGENTQEKMIFFNGFMPWKLNQEFCCRFKNILNKKNKTIDSSIGALIIKNYNTLIKQTKEQDWILVKVVNIKRQIVKFYYVK